MAEQKQMTMDNITPHNPAVADTGPPAELPPNEHPIEPLDLIEEPKVRTKLRIYAILAALYVHYPILAFSASTNRLTVPPQARPLRSSPRPDHHRYIHPHNLRRSALRFRLRLDRRRLLARQRRRRSNLGQMQRHLGSQARSLGRRRHLCRCEHHRGREYKHADVDRCAGVAGHSRRWPDANGRHHHLGSLQHAAPSVVYGLVGLHVGARWIRGASDWRGVHPARELAVVLLGQSPRVRDRVRPLAAFPRCAQPAHEAGRWRQGR